LGRAYYGPDLWALLPGGKPPAPGRLRTVQAFVNTVNRESGEDVIAHPDGLRAWLDRFELLDASCRIDEVAVERAWTLREALRDLLRANAGHDVQIEAARAEVEHVGRSAHLALRLDGGAPLVSLAPGLDGAFGTIVALMGEAMLDGSWPRLKACRREVCRWAFYDHSHAGTGAWCSMSICGSRSKASSYRDRHGRGDGAS
jgi:predicted RNA-binding Zn ribbon-like protein